MYGVEFGQEDYLLAGADDVFGARFDSPSARVRARTDFRRRWPLAHLRGSGMLARHASLDRLDRVVELCRRLQVPLTVCLVHLDGLDDLRGLAAPLVHSALRTLRATLDEGLRFADVVGHVNDDALILGLVDCRREAATRRLADLRKRFYQRARRDRRLAGITLHFGLADSELGLNGISARAENDLQASRARKPS